MSENKDESYFKRIYNNLSENSTQISICFIAEFKQNEDELRKLFKDFVDKLEEKIPNKSNKYASIINTHYHGYNYNNGFYNTNKINYIDFELKDNFFSKLKNQQNLENKNLDVFKCAYLKLKWRRSNKIIIRIVDNEIKSKIKDDSKYEKQLKDNSNVNIYTLNKMKFKSLVKFLDDLKIDVKPETQEKDQTNTDSESAEEISEKSDKIILTYFEIDENTIDDTLTNLAKTNLKQIEENYERSMIDIQPKQFENGNEVFCFKGTFLYKSKDGKENKKDKVFKLAKDRRVNVEENHKAQVIARFLANRFSKQQKKIKISYTRTCIVQFDNKKYLMDDYIEGSYTKFSSNEFLFNPIDDWRLIEFSHWTYKITNGRFLVTDLQGCQKNENEYILSDPAIHSLDDNFGITDLSKNGMNRFFAFHKCNYDALMNRTDDPNEQNLQPKRRMGKSSTVVNCKKNANCAGSNQEIDEHPTDPMQTERVLNNNTNSSLSTWQQANVFTDTQFNDQQLKQHQQMEMSTLFNLLMPYY